MELRRFQQQFIQVALDKLERGEKYMVANVHPGSGKTRGALLAANALIGTGAIKKVAVFVPRLNLCEQFEIDTQEFVKWLPNCNLTSIEHRGNIEPLIRGNANGFVATYASLTASKDDIHRRLFEKYSGEWALICDEAQQLGADFDGTTNRSTDFIRELAKHARLTIVMTGTPERADGAPIFGGTYSDPDADGYRFLLPDVEATYTDGVRDGYLRRFEFELVGGEAIWQRMGYDPERLVLSQMDGGLYRVVLHEDYWRPLVDRLVDMTRESQLEVDPRMASLIGAYHIRQAREILDYLKSHHQNVKSLIAVSDDGEAAKSSLRQFKNPATPHDILISVNMAYVGYDHKPIINILPLTGYRTPSYLRQFTARALRVMPDIPEEKQITRVLAPDDTEMVAFVEMLRTESQQGIKEKGIGTGGGEGGEPQPLGVTEQAWTTTIHNRANDPVGDLYGGMRERVMQVIAENKISVPPATFYAAAQALMKMKEQPAATVTPSIKLQREPMPMTQRERELQWRDELKRKTGQCDYQLANGEFGTTNSQLYGVFHKKRDAMTVDELQRALKLVTRWLEAGHYD